MPWGRLDDSLYDHPKLDHLGEEHRLAGVGLWTVAISWCNRFGTDGHVPRGRIAKLGGSVELADRLVAAGLFDEDPAGYQVHDFLEFNDSRDEVSTRRKNEAARKAAWRAAHRNGKSPGGTLNGAEDDVPAGVPPTSREESRRPSRDSTRASRSANPGPARPDPADSDSSRSETSTREAEPGGPILSKAQLEAWATFGPEWEPFKAAWLARGFRHPPSGEADDPRGQRGMLYPIVDARPTSITTWIREAKGKTAHQVVGHLLERWHAVQAEAGVEEDEREPAVPRSASMPTPIADLVPDWAKPPEPSS